MTEQTRQLAAMSRQVDPAFIVPSIEFTYHPEGA